MGNKDEGPIKQNASAIQMLPMHDAIFGFNNLSTIHPQNGAVNA